MDFIPDVETHTNAQIQRREEPRVIKSHDPYDPRYPRVIYIVRDPRSVAVSYYHYHRRKGQLHSSTSLDAFVETFLDGQSLPYGSWRNHVASWQQVIAGDSDRGLLIRYEDMLKEPIHQAERIATFLGLPADKAILHPAVEGSSFDALQEQESTMGRAWRGNRNVANTHVKFFRKGRPDEWREALSDASVRAIESTWAETMSSLGYQPLGTSASKAGDDADPRAH